MTKLEENAIKFLDKSIFNLNRLRERLDHIQRSRKSYRELKFATKEREIMLRQMNLKDYLFWKKVKP